MGDDRSLRESGRSASSGRPPSASRVLDLRQPEEREQAEIEPADVELVPLRLELRRAWVSVVVVVQLLAPEPDRDREDVPALVLYLEVAIADGVADAVDDSRRPERDPDHLHAPDER